MPVDRKAGLERQAHDWVREADRVFLGQDVHLSQNPRQPQATGVVELRDPRGVRERGPSPSTAIALARAVASGPTAATRRNR